MSTGEKPYRVYRGGRVKGKVPALPHPGPTAGSNGRTPHPGGTGPKPGPGRRRLGWKRGVALALGALFLLVLVWGVASFLSLRGGVAAANERLDRQARAALTPQDGLLLSKPTTILLLGTDHANRADRATARRSDSIMLVRTDPEHGRIYQLSIPRDLRAEVPGLGPSKINAAFQVGGPALAVRTVRGFTGVPINHIATVDFGNFSELIDAVGGIEVDVPKPIFSNAFDCPYKPDRCLTWEGWRFAKGKQHMDGRRALVYSRIRENRLDPADNDITRGERQQEVLDAISAKLTSAGTLARLPFIGGDLVRPLATDLSTSQLVQLGWLKLRASKTIHCRLGGTPSTVGGQSFILPTEENRNVVAMFRGTSAPQPPPPGTGTFGPGCRVRS